MKLRVEFHGVDGDGFPIKRGEIVWDGTKLTGDNPGMKTIIETPVIAHGRQIKAEDEPEEFIKNLFMQYRSPYLQATEPLKV